MRLIRRSRHGADPIRHISPGGDLVAACVVLGLMLTALIDTIDPALFLDAEMEFAIFDFGADAAVLGAADWPLLRFLLIGSAILAAASALLARGHRVPPRLRSADAPRPGKVPI